MLEKIGGYMPDAGLIRRSRVELSILAADALLATALLLLGIYMLWITFINRSFMLILPAMLFISIGGLKMAKAWPILLASGNGGEPGVLHKSVLVPVSRPETVKSLVDIACSLLEKGGTLRLINVIEVPQQLPFEYAETRKGKARELLMEASKHCERHGVRPKLEIVAARDIPQAILDTASRYGADLIVMGSSQRTVPEKFLFGNVVDRVLRGAQSEVVIFSYAKALKPIRYDRILVPTSGYRHAQRALDIALHFQRMTGGSVTSLFVGSEAESDKGSIILKKARLHAERLGSSIETIFRVGGVVDNIIDVAKSGGYSLIIIGATERPSYYTFLLGSTADEIVTRAPCNVLVVRTRK
jgi:nucleotide-binding universal stress UspA family protein